VSLAQALVGHPEVLLLDEPTNHLDLAAIEWLEQYLLSFPGTLMFVTHDRMVLDRLATGIVELDRGHLRCFSWHLEHLSCPEARAGGGGRGPGGTI
jgi:ATP-binding cassette subfamily F protein uup